MAREIVKRAVIQRGSVLHNVKADHSQRSSVLSVEHVSVIELRKKIANRLNSENLAIRRVRRSTRGRIYSVMLDTSSAQKKRQSKYSAFGCKLSNGGNPMLSHKFRIDPSLDLAIPVFFPCSSRLFTGFEPYRDVTLPVYISANEENL